MIYGISRGHDACWKVRRKEPCPMLPPYLGAVVAASMLVLFAGLFHLDEKRKERAKRAR